MEKISGLAVSSGIAIARAFVLDDFGFVQAAPRIPADRVESELERLRTAINEVLANLQRDRETTTARLGSAIGNIFEAHRETLNNSDFTGEMETLVRRDLSSAESAVTTTCNRYSQLLANIENGRNAMDMEDIRRRLSRQLAGGNTFLEHLASLDADAKVVILAHNLTPGETASLPLSHVRGFVTELGGPTSHTAILATALNIPAVVGTGEFLKRAEQDDEIIVDGDQGLVILRPDLASRKRYGRLLVERATRHDQRLEQMRDQESRTLDDKRIMLLANIELPDEIPAVLEHGADGVGLYRTEFLYINRDTLPDEEEHFEAYRSLLEQLGSDRQLTIRTFDLGADKVAHSLGLKMERENNPNLGLRSIRLSLRSLSMFRTQLRAILRASAWDGQPHQNLRVMLPMVTSAWEVRLVRSILSDLKEDLAYRGIPYNDDLSLGIMVETPATVLKLHYFCQQPHMQKRDRLVRFLSIGTNDLVQYTLAADRGNCEVSEWYQEADPAVIEMMKKTVRWGRSEGIPVSCCGQMAGNPRFLMLLLGLGLRILSMPPHLIPQIKALIRSVSIAECREVVREVQKFEEARDIGNFLRLRLRELDSGDNGGIVGKGQEFRAENQ